MCGEGGAGGAGDGNRGEELLELSGAEGMNGRHDFTYVLALAAARGLEGDAKAEAYFNTGAAAATLPNKMEKAEEHYRKAIEANPKFAEVHYNYALVLSEIGLTKEAEDHYHKAFEANPKLITWNILISNLRRFLLYVITGIIAIYLAYRLLGLVLEANTIK